MKTGISLFISVFAIMPVMAFADIDIDSGYPLPQNATVTVGDSVTFSVRADTNDSNGSGATNDDWQSTQWDVLGDDADGVCLEDPNINGDTLNTTVTWAYTANDAGTHNVQVKVFNGAGCAGAVRDVANTQLTVNPVIIPVIDVCPNVSGNQLVGPCADTLCTIDETWSTTNQACEANTVATTTPPVEPPTESSSESTPASTSTSGGGGFTFCDLDTQPTSALRDIAMCVDRDSGKVVQSLAWRAGQSGNGNGYVLSLMWQAVGLLNQMIEIVKTK
jgi:hypothetical protein